MEDRKRVLLADTDVRRRRVTATLLRLGGYHVIEVARLEEIPSAAREGIDILISDAQLADGDAVEYAGRLRKNASTARLPVLILSIDSALEAKVSGALGAAAFVLIPARPSELLGRVGSLLSLSAAR